MALLAVLPVGHAAATAVFPAACPSPAAATAPSSPFLLLMLTQSSIARFAKLFDEISIYGALTVTALPFPRDLSLSPLVAVCVVPAAALVLPLFRRVPFYVCLYKKQHWRQPK